MKKSFFYSLLLAFYCLPGLSSAQGFCVDDYYTFTVGQSLNFNVTDNDSVPFGLPVKLVYGDTLCFKLEPDGQLIFIGSSECCGSHYLTYDYEIAGDLICSANVFVNVKCKPDCFFVNLDNLPSGGNGGGQECAYACENSEATYYVNYNPSYTYTWSVTGGTFVPGANPAEILVFWGPKGSGSVLLTTVNSNNETKLKQACVNILEGPVAGFEAPPSVCLNEPVTFTNTSQGGDGFFWDFGDGHTSTMFEPTHEYAASGTYKVCLIVTRQNYDTQIPNDVKGLAKSGVAPHKNFIAPGDPLCCCTDTICMDVVVTPLQGPNIYCISTLCANDSSEYWTDAANCATYYWSAMDENGAPLTFSGQGTDRISVHWGAGPVGTVSLYVNGCDNLYCDDTVSVIVPVMSATTTINGPKSVCENASATYTVQKWISAYYEWQVTNGTILSGQGTNALVVQWGPGGTGTIDVNYYSDFLGGLPGHDPADCMGTASLTVDIKPRFDLFPGPTVECRNNLSFYSAFPATGYTWSITPPVSFSGQGTSDIFVTWNTAPGTYVVKAEPIDPTLYCNEFIMRAIDVIKIPKPLGIEGPAEICPGETYTYIGKTSEAGVGFNWNVAGGTAAFYDGYSITVTWDVAGPYSLSLSQSLLSSPYCTSDTVQLTVSPKLLNSPLAISGPAVACINSLFSYAANPVQHPEAKYTWSIQPAYLGSVASGQGTPNIVVQWNNDVGTADLSLAVELCGSIIDTIMKIPVVAAVKPHITQTSAFCLGQTGTLDAGAGFASYAWSTSGSGQTISISSSGIYSVTTTDANGCTAFDAYKAVAVPGPSVTLPPLVTLCITPPNPVSVTLATTPGYTYSWTLDGALLVLPPNQNSVTHNNSNVPETFVYSVTATDASGCTAVDQSEVKQLVCPAGCTPEPYSLSFTGIAQFPNCNIVDFAASSSANVTLTEWDFNDPNTDLPGGPFANISHTYTQAGCYNVLLYAAVPGLGGSGSCLVSTSQTVCVDVAANFNYTNVCETLTFTDLSSFLGGQDITNWSWSFGDGGSSNLQNPVHTYPGPGNYHVTLTVSNAAGCQATIVKQVVAGGLAKPVITAIPSPYCVDKPISFSAASTGAVSWFWDFNDMAENASPSPFHTYVANGSFNVTLTVTDAEGCTNIASLPLTANALPPDDVIVAAPGLTVCDGTNVTLTAPSGVGYTYLWSSAETSQSIVTTTAGKYSVTVTGPDGCTMEPDPVTVVILPSPPASISGSHYICSGGCTLLNAPLGNAYTYQWYDNIGNPIPGAIFSSLSVCDYSLSSPYKVKVTDSNTMCSAISSPFDVSVVPSPSFSVDASPDDCAGAKVTLQVVPVQSDVTYAWNNGATGPSTVVQQAGIYIAVGTDTITGCKGTASAIIHPQPDLCLVPVGCYNVCDPDTICGPDNLASYQWNMNGISIPGETGQCLIVTQNGEYSLTGTTTDGCSLTSDTLRLKTVNCGCYGLNASVEPVTTTDGCCWSANYVNPFDNKYRLAIRSDDTDFIFDLGSLDAALTASSVLPGSVLLTNNVVGAPLPMGTLNGFLTFCLTNQHNTPPQIIFDWYDDAFNVVCSDTVELVTSYTAGITCPANIAVSASSGSGSAIVNYALPTATSDCPCPGINLQLTAGLASGSAFPVGTTQVCYMATDSCGNTATCCFTVEVSGSTACDVKTSGCITYELLGISQNGSQEKTYRIRVTNSCSGKLVYAAFQLPNGVTAKAPADNSVYTAPSSREYQVRNPNASPFHSIRFKPTTGGIANGESDIFQYRLPAYADPDYIHVISRLESQISYEAHLNVFNCPVGATPSPKMKAKTAFQVFPNPSGGTLFADLSSWKGEEVRLRILGSSGQYVLDLALTADPAPQAIPLPDKLASGLYTLEVLTAEGERAEARFVLAR